MPTQPHLLGIAGPSCSGKTSLARFIARTLPAVVIALDSYYIDLAHLPLEQRARTNFDEPKTLDWDLIVRQLGALVRGQAVERPVYDFSKHTRMARAEWVEPAPLIVVEGLFTLQNERLRAMLDSSVYIAVDDDLCFARRLARDITERGRTPESVHRQYALTVRPMAERYVYPSRELADLVVSGAGTVAELESRVMAWLLSTAGPWPLAIDYGTAPAPVPPV